VSKEKIKLLNTSFIIQVYSDDKLLTELESSFNGPLTNIK